MFERFLAAYTAGLGCVPDPWMDEGRLNDVRGYNELAGRVGGCALNGGLYRLHSRRSGPVGQRAASAAFPQLQGQASVFGYDWLGRQFAMDFRRAPVDPTVLLLEPGTGDILDIPLSFADFHDLEIVDDPQPSFAVEFFREWSGSHPSDVPLSWERCVGYRIPLFLGGSDEVANLEVVDFEVYWEISAQLLASVRGIPEGTRIGRGGIEDPRSG